MAFGKIELGEIVILAFDVGAFRNRKAHIGEDRNDLLGHLAIYGVQLGAVHLVQEGHRVVVQALPERLVDL